ncbi:MAG: prepilin-type N-terminal cleavage/methylation domain-containing protein [Candidatus Gracilibacteria bacterium]|nr:prepilin-type N-terminal cleavage/methylation domain-containing protein [Candidatus Gracilibacteria bacterium]
MKKAFTIVELIIVITILTILSTVGYMSYLGHIVTVKDNNRINQIHNIGDGIDLQLSKGKNIKPENSIEIYVGGKKYSTQGVAGQKVLGESGFIGKGLDPKDNEYYTFSLASNNKDYQIMSFLESKNNLPKSLKEFNVFGTKIPYVYGKNSLGIILDDLGNPLNKVLTGTINIDCGIDEGYKMIFQDGRILDGIVNQSEFEKGPCYIKPANGCTVAPTYVNAVYNVGTPTEPYQEWVKGDNTVPCSYTCINGYTGLFCENP